MSCAYLGLGSDLGDRPRALRCGLRQLAVQGLRIGALSSLYLTEPVGDPGLPWFLNCAVQVLAPPPPEELLAACLRAEQRCGRRRPGGPPRAEAARTDATAHTEDHAGGGPPQARTLDIDVLLYDRRVLAGPGVRLPHPRMHERRFVLRPLAEIAPDAIHPPSGRRVRELLERLEPGEGVWLLAPPLQLRGI